VGPHVPQEDEKCRSSLGLCDQTCTQEPEPSIWHPEFRDHSLTIVLILPRGHTLGKILIHKPSASFSVSKKEVWKNTSL
jgi:hypothetical protein